MKRLILLVMLTPSFAASQEPAPREPVRSLDLSGDGRLFDQWFQRFGHQAVRTVAPEKAGARFQLPAVKHEEISGTARCSLWPGTSR